MEEKNMLGAALAEIAGPVLELVASVEVDGAKRFVAADHLVVGNAGIAFLGENLKNAFLGKVETDVQPTTLRIHRLAEPSLDAPIRAELGSDREEIALAHFWAVFKKRSVSAEWFFAYIRGTGGDLWAVGAYRSGGDWDVYADSVTSPSRWSAGSQVLSR